MRRLLPVVLAVACLACTRSVDPKRLSVVLVTLDTTRADRIGAYGGGDLTPRLDAAAEDGVILREAVSQVPLTLPSHASILTARYPATHGVRYNGTYRLRDDETTLAEALKGAGFETAAFVASFVLNRGFGVEQGFDVYDDVPVNRFADGQDRVFEAQRRADEVNARVFDWLDHRADPSRRFFLWVHYYDPHDPYDAPDVPGRTLRGTGYDREISYMDGAFGDLLDRLRAEGVLDSAILVVAADHGESLGDHGERNHGIFLYEPAVHVPAFLRAKGLFPAGAEVRGPVELVDLAPTVLDYLGLPPLPDAQGRSLRARIEGKDDGRDALAHAESLTGRIQFGWAELRMVRDGRYKYVAAPVPELYDLKEDPKERQNLAPNENERAAEYAARLSSWTGATTDSAASTEAGHKLDPSEEALLRSLGYLGASEAGAGEESALDPKEGIREMHRLEEARDALRDGDASRALALADALLSERPRNHEARATKVDALIRLKRLVEAEDETLQQLAEASTGGEASGPLADQARATLADIYRFQGKGEEAVRQYRRILEGDPANDVVAADLARTLFVLGRTEEAGKIAGEVLSRDPRFGPAVAVRFLLAVQRGDSAAALDDAKALADLRAGDPDVLVEAATRLQAAGDPARTAVCYEVLLAQIPVLDPGIVGRMGQAKLAARDLDGAEEAFRAASTLAPHDPRPPYFLGTIALARGDEAAAKRSFDRAVALDGRFSDPLTTWGRYLASKGRSEEAAEAFRGALARNPADRAAAAGLSALENR